MEKKQIKKDGRGNIASNFGYEWRRQENDLEAIVRIIGKPPENLKSGHTLTCQLTLTKQQHSTLKVGDKGGNLSMAFSKKYLWNLTSGDTYYLFDMF